MMESFGIYLLDITEWRICFKYIHFIVDRSRDYDKRWLALRATSRPDYHQIDRGLCKLRSL